MAARDPYEVLGVPKDASAEDIRSAYRKLAKRHHPDLNPGKPEAEDRFKEISAAHALLSDPEQRARYDRGEIDAAGTERPQQPYYRDFGDAQPGARYRAWETNQAVSGEDVDLDDLFSTFFGRQRSETGGFRSRGGDARYTMTVDFLEAATGAQKRITLPDGRSLDVAIPAGLRDGQVLRLRGQGGPGIGGGPAGDALIEVRVAPHPLFQRDGDDIRIELPITLGEAVLGGRVPVPTVDGSVTMRVPKNANTGTVLRLKGKGLPRSGGGRGDQYVTLKIALRGTPDPELEAFVRDWAPKHPYDPRRGLEGS